MVVQKSQKKGKFGVIFDFDNTILETEPLAEKILLEILEFYDVSITREERDWMVGRSWAEIYHSLFVPRSFPLSIGELADLVIEKKEACLQTHLPLLPGAKEAILSLASHYPMAIVTGSYRRELISALRMIGIEQFLSGTIAAEDVKKGKPDPEPYLKGCRLLDCSPQSVIVFEDSEPGIQSAKTAGCICIGVRAGAFNETSLEQADRIIDTLDIVGPDFISRIIMEITV